MGLVPDLVSLDARHWRERAGGRFLRLQWHQRHAARRTSLPDRAADRFAVGRCCAGAARQRSLVSDHYATA